MSALRARRGILAPALAACCQTLRGVQKRERLQSGLHFIGAAKPLKHQLFLVEEAQVSSPSSAIGTVNPSGGDEQRARDVPPASGHPVAEDISAVAGPPSAGQLLKLSRCVPVPIDMKTCCAMAKHGMEWQHAITIDFMNVVNPVRPQLLHRGLVHIRHTA
jgi:hypothetical protein